MHTIEQIFINGEFVTPHGTEWFDLYNPATAQVIGQVRLADEVDAERAMRRRKRRFRRGRRPQSRNASPR
jgi:aldehyde dehydrogenase (NAD+)